MLELQISDPPTENSTWGLQRRSLLSSLFKKCAAGPKQLYSVVFQPKDKSYKTGHCFALPTKSMVARQGPWVGGSLLALRVVGSGGGYGVTLDASR